MVCILAAAGLAVARMNVLFCRTARARTDQEALAPLKPGRRLGAGPGLESVPQPPPHRPTLGVRGLTGSSVSGLG